MKQQIVALSLGIGMSFFFGTGVLANDYEFVSLGKFKEAIRRLENQTYTCTLTTQAIRETNIPATIKLSDPDNVRDFTIWINLDNSRTINSKFSAYHYNEIYPKDTPKYYHLNSNLIYRYDLARKTFLIRGLYQNPSKLGFYLRDGFAQYLIDCDPTR